MAVLSKGQTFATGDQVTALKLNDLVDDATFASGAVDNASTQLSGGAIIVKDGGVTTAKINDGAVTTAKILDANVTKAKIENLADYTVLGNVSGGAAAPAEVSILDEDDMASDSDTAIATQQSVKAYVENKGLGYNQTWQEVTRTIGTEYTNDTGKPIALMGYAFRNAGGSIGLNIIIDGVTVAFIHGANAIGFDLTNQIIIPTSSTYQLSNQEDPLSNALFWELRTPAP